MLDEMDDNVKLRHIGTMESMRRLNKPSPIQGLGRMPVYVPGMYASGREAIRKMVGTFIICVAVVITGAGIWYGINELLGFFR